MALRGTASSPATGQQTTATITVTGIGIQLGDIVLLGVMGGGGSGTSTFTFPSGFSAIPTQLPINSATALATAWKVATGSEPSTYTITSSNSDSITAQCRAYSGRSASQFTATQTTNPAGTGVLPQVVSIAGLTAAAGCDLVIFAGPDNNDSSNSNTYTMTGPTGFSNLVVSQSLTGFGFNAFLFSNDSVNVSAGATGTLSATETCTITGNNTTAAFLLALTPSSSPNTASIAWTV